MKLRILLSLLWALIALTSARAISVQDMLAAGRADDAIATLREQTARAPKDAESFNFLCRAYFMVDEWDRSIEACERARDLDPQKSLYHLWLGRAYGEKADRVGFLSAAGLAKKVRTSFERAVELDPRSWEARSDLAQFYLDAPGIVGGGKEKAVAQANALMELKPGIGHWILARVAEKNKDLAGAEAEYRAGIEVTHSGARALLDYAIFLRYHNRFDDMDKILQTLETTTVVDRRESLMDGGSVLLRAGRDYPLGERLVRRYLKDPVEEGPAFKAHDLLGQLMERQGNTAGAAAEYRAALALAQEYGRAREDLKRVEH
jgi:tetratricopeptide (TPR) repeat protein